MPPVPTIVAPIRSLLQGCFPRPESPVCNSTDLMLGPECRRLWLVVGMCQAPARLG